MDDLSIWNKKRRLTLILFMDEINLNGIINMCYRRRSFIVNKVQFDISRLYSSS